MTQKKTVALIYDFDGTLSPGNMQEYDFIPAVGKSNREFCRDGGVCNTTPPQLIHFVSFSPF